MPRRRGAVWGLVVATVLVASPALGHAGHGGVDEALVAEGTRLLVGDYDAPQAGPLVVVPYRDGPLPCGAAQKSGFRLPLGEGSAVTFVANATHVEAGFDLAQDGFIAFAVDSDTASRALLQMQEHAVSRHLLVAEFVRRNGTEWAPDGIEGPRRGVLGIPYQVPGAGQHDWGHALEWGGIGFAYDTAVSGRTVIDTCVSAEPGHLALWLRRDALRATLAPGNVVHAVALFDAAAPSWPPHPLDTTGLFQANLYLARPGEDPEALAEAFRGDAAPETWLPLVALAGAVGAGLVVTLRRR